MDKIPNQAIDFGRTEQAGTADIEEVLALSARLIEQNAEAYKVLTK